MFISLFLSHHATLSGNLGLKYLEKKFGGLGGDA